MSKKCIVAGGRDYLADDKARDFLEYTLEIQKVTEVVSGGCTGADRFGEETASKLGIPVKIFFAD